MSVPDLGTILTPTRAEVSRRRIRRSGRGTTQRGSTRSSGSIAALLLAIAGLLASIAFISGVSSVRAAELDPSSSPDPTPPPLATIVFYGHGYGHGVGMSQYGARGRALAGQDAATILAHYYQGTILGTTNPNRPVRILVLQAFVASPDRPLRLYGRSGPWTIDGIADVFPSDAQLRVTKIGTGFRAVVRDAGGAVLLDTQTKGTIRLRPTVPATGRIQVFSKPSAYDLYRGVIRLRARSHGIDVIDETTLDLYVRGVVPVEMPAGWPIEALRAQAIATRSYAAHRLHPKTGFYDLYDDGRTQVYRGSRAERAATNRAIADTSGIVLRNGLSIANTLFSSTGGGATENNENVFTTATGQIVAGPVPYLRGSADVAPDGTPYDADAPRASWQTAAYTLDQLSAFFAADDRTNVGTLTALDLSSVGVSGRLIRVTLTGSLGTKTVSGAVFRSVFNAQTPAADPYMWSTLVSTSPIPAPAPTG